MTESGSKNIEELKSYEEYSDECDWILSRDENNPAGEVHARRVLKRFIREAPVLNIHVGGRIIGTTAEHPFYVAGFGWKTASELVIGDRLLGMGGQSVRVDGIADSGRTDFVYNNEWRFRLGSWRMESMSRKTNDDRLHTF